MVARCSAVVACSVEVRHSLCALLGMDPERAAGIVAVPNGIDVPEPLEAAERERVRERHGVPHRSPLVLAAGRLTQQKDFATLIDAAAALRGRLPGVTFIVAGEGELRADLEERIRARGLQEEFRLPGNLLELRDLMQAADLFVLSSRWEGLPLVLLEAMAAALPVVGTRIKGLTDVVEEGRTGLLVPPGDAAALADALADLLGSAERRLLWGRAGRARIAAEFGLDRTVAALDRLYSAAIQH
jgi:glycosyltransferase involved in cell wall biosynthesis